MFTEIKTHGASGTITLNDPARKNCLNAMGLLNLQQALEDLRQQRSVRGIIITGAGDAFSSGTDLLALKHQMDADPLDQNNSDLEILTELLLAMFRYPKPIITALNGPALGNGAAIALAGDIIIGDTSSKIAFPESGRGLVASFGGAMLSFKSPTTCVSKMLLTGETMDAQQAKDNGLINEVVAPDLTWARAHEIIDSIGESSPQSIQLTRKYLYESLTPSIESILRSACGTAATARFTLAAREGVSAFIEKRTPDWDEAYNTND